MTLDELKLKMDEAIAAYAGAVRENSVLTGYHLVYVSIDYAELGTGSGWYDRCTLPGQPHHVTEGLADIGKHLLARNFLEG